MGLWRFLSLGIFLLLTGPLAAQETDASNAGEQSGTDSEVSEAADGSEPVEAEDDSAPEDPPVGSTYVPETFTDWSLSCVVSGTGNDPCRFIQVLNNGEGGRVAQVSIVPLPPGRGVPAAAIIETPLGTLLRVPQSANELDQPGGIRLRVDSGELRVFQFTFCTESGCVAEIGMEQALVDAFKRGNTATITVWSVDSPGQPVELQLSLAGFTAGYNRVAQLSGVTEQ